MILLCLNGKRCSAMCRWRWMLVQVILVMLVAKQVWSILSCPTMLSPAACLTTYHAGCGWLCRAYAPLTTYYCCCPGGLEDCCQAVCTVWSCVLVVPYIPCPTQSYDVEFVGLFWYINSNCIHAPSPPAPPMAGGCS